MSTSSLLSPQTTAAAGEISRWKAIQSCISGSGTCFLPPPAFITLNPFKGFFLTSCGGTSLVANSNAQQQKRSTTKAPLPVPDFSRLYTEPILSEPLNAQKMIIFSHSEQEPWGVNTWVNSGERSKVGFNKRGGDNACVKSVIRAGIVFSEVWFHGSWKNNGAAGLFIIEMCSFKKVPPSSQHIHLLRNYRRQWCSYRYETEAGLFHCKQAEGRKKKKNSRNGAGDWKQTKSLSRN